MLFKAVSIWKRGRYAGYIILVGLILHSQILLADGFPKNYYQRNYSSPRKSGVRRGINIDLQVDTEAPNSKLKLQEVLEDMMQAAQAELDSSDGLTLCPTCTNVKEKPLRKIIQELKPGYPCDHWNPKSRHCAFDRNIGDSVTFVLDIPPTNSDNSLNIVWKQEFKIRDSENSKNFTIDPDTPPWNIVIGSRGSELRLSPITELDVDFNYFSATIDNGEYEDLSNKRRVIFKIRVMPIDLGTLYPGAFLMLNMLSYASLPQSSMTFKWYMEDENEMKALPSNMRVSRLGSLLTISELRREQQGIMACAVYTNLNVFATKKRFLIREVSQDNNRLMFLPTRPIKYQKEIPQRPFRNKRQLESNFNEDETGKYDDNESRSPYNYDKDEDIDSNKKPFAKSEFTSPHKYDSSSDRDPFASNRFEGTDSSNKPNFKSEIEETHRNQDSGDRDRFTSNTDDHINSKNKTNSKSAFAETHKYSHNADQGHFDRNRNRFPDSYAKPKSEFEDHRKYDDNSVRLDFRPNINDYADSNRIPNYKPRLPEETLGDITESVELPTQADEEYEAKKRTVSTSDKIAMLISTCDVDVECSMYGSCIKVKKTEPGFCHCMPRFEGSGIFCWEVHKYVT